MNEKNQSQLLERLVRKLDILILLHLEGIQPGAHQPSRKKIETLLGLGLRPSDIGDIIGKPTNYVTASIAQLKSRKGTVRSSCQAQ